MAKIGGFRSWRLVGFWVWIGALCVALSVAPMVIFVLAWFDGGSDGGVLAWFELMLSWVFFFFFFNVVLVLV